MKLRKIYIDCLILTVMGLILWCGLAITFFRESYPYLYPYIYDVDTFIFGTGVTLGSSLILLLLCGLYSFLQKRVQVYICFFLVLVLLFMGVFRLSIETIASPTVYSYTQDISCFGRYDKKVSVPEEFPEEIPKEAEDVQYYYFYIDASSTEWYIAISWRGKDADMVEEYTGSDERLKVFVIPEEQRVYYVAVSQSLCQVESPEQVFSWSPHGTVFGSRSGE